MLTAGTKIEQGKKAGDPIAASVVTLMVTPDDAERVALASSEGKIILTLRNPLDTLAHRHARRSNGEPDGRAAGRRRCRRL